MHEVNIDARKTRGFGGSHGAARLIGSVDSAQFFKLGIIKALYAEREPVDTRRQVVFKGVVLKGARVCLKRDFGVIIDSEDIFKLKQQLAV